MFISFKFNSNYMYILKPNWQKDIHSVTDNAMCAKITRLPETPNSTSAVHFPFE